MSKSTPQMLTGMRAPRAVRMEEMAKQAEEDARALPTPPAAQEGVTVYVSATRRYRVQVTAPQSYIGPDGRKMSGGKRIEAQFEDGVYRNGGPGTPGWRNPTVRALIDESLQANPYFGRFGSTAHFWLASEQQEKTRKAALESAMHTLKSLPKEAVDAFVGQLRASDDEDHAVPAPAARGGDEAAQ